MATLVQDAGLFLPARPCFVDEGCALILPSRKWPDGHFSAAFVGSDLVSARKLKLKEGAMKIRKHHCHPDRREGSPIPVVGRIGWSRATMG